MIADILQHGGLVLLLIILASIAASTLVLERSLRLRKWRRECRISQALCRQERGADLVRALQGRGDFLARSVLQGIWARQGGDEAMRSAALDEAQRAVPPLERGLSALQLIAQVAPLLGLLGTVLGLMRAFDATSGAEAVTAQLLAGGIYQALGTTAAGLMVAVPVHVAHGMLGAGADALLRDLEQAAADCPLLLRQPEAG